jgi:predicted dehydrogenase
MLLWGASWPSKDPGQYVNLFRNLAHSIAGKEEQAVKWEESTLAVEIIQLAHQSSKEGRTITVRPA